MADCAWLKNDVLTLEDLALSRQAIEALPIGVYVVTLDGEFVDANQVLRQLLDIPLDATPPPGKITDYYADPEQRTRLIERVSSGSLLAREIVEFRVGDRNLFVQMTCRAVLDEGGGEPRAYIGSLVDVTDEVTYHKLFDHLPAGIYELDAEDRVVRANDAFARLHGFASGAEISGTSIRDLHADFVKASEIRELIIQRRGLLNETVELKQRSGEVFVASLTAIPLFDHRGHYCGRQGTIVDVTREWRYRKIIDDIPVGLYMAERREGRDIIVDCNRQFARIHEYDSTEQVVGININELHYSPEESAGFLKRIEQAGRQGQPLLGEALKIRTHKNNIRTLELNVLPLITGDRLVQHTGSVRDITEEVELRTRIAQISSDIGRVLHLYTQTLMQLNHIMEIVRDVLGPDPFVDADSLDPMPVKKLTAEPRAQLSGSLNALLRELDAAEQSALPENERLRLRELLDLLEHYEEIIPYGDLRGLALIDTAVELQRLCRGVVPGRIPRHYSRQVQRAAQEVARLNTLRIVHQAQETISALDHQVNSVREYVIAGRRATEPFLAVTAISVTRQAIDAVLAFAKSRDVAFDVRNYVKDLRVSVRTRDTARALANLLHNAVKYSWKRPNTQRPWVVVALKTADETLRISVESFGVPIPRDEIATGRIFQLGYRGRLSSDRGRVGTGIGLADAWQVAVEHGGTIEVDSHPIEPNADPERYEQPFLTTLTVVIPFGF